MVLTDSGLEDVLLAGDSALSSLASVSVPARGLLFARADSCGEGVGVVKSSSTDSRPDVVLSGVPGRLPAVDEAGTGV